MITVVVFIIVTILLYFIYKKLLEFNHVDYGSRWVNCIMGLNQFLCRKFHKLDDYWLDLPEKGGVIVAANHQSGIDPPALLAASRRPVRFLCSSYYYKIPVLRILLEKVGCIPIYRDKNNKVALRDAVKALKNGEVIGIFPFAGFHASCRKEPRMRSGVAVLANLADVDVIPVRVDGVAEYSKNKVFTSMTFVRSDLQLRQYAAISTAKEEDIEKTLDYLYSILSNHGADTEEVTVS